MHSCILACIHADIHARLANLMAAENILKWDVYQWRLYFNWMGHVARMGSDRWTHKVLRYKDLAYIAKLKEDFGYQTPGRPFRAWRLEWPLYQFAKDWLDHARDSAAWQRTWTDWLQWRKFANISA